MCSPRSGGCHCVLWFDFPVRQTQCSNSVRDNKLYSRYPGKSVSSEVERNWVKMGGQMEVGELLGHKKKTWESFGDLTQLQVGLASSWVSIDWKIPIHAKWDFYPLTNKMSLPFFFIFLFLVFN